MPNTPLSSPPYSYTAGHSGSTEQALESNLPSAIDRSMEAIEDYARREPWAFAGWVFAVGFILGWKLKFW